MYNDPSWKKVKDKTIEVLVDGKNLDEIDITAINYDTFETAFESSFNDDSDDAKRMKQFLFEQLRYFEDSRDSISIERQNQLNGMVVQQLKNHQASVQNQFSFLNPATFDTSQFCMLIWI